jgi:hypothetical protein
MKPETKVTPKRSSAPEPEKHPRSSLDLIPVSATPQQIIERLEAVITQLKRLPIPTGPTGGYLLDALELTDQIRDEIRAKARTLLVEQPDLIEGWHVETQTIYRLCRDKESRS